MKKLQIIEDSSITLENSTEEGLCRSLFKGVLLNAQKAIVKQYTLCRVWN